MGHRPAVQGDLADHHPHAERADPGGQQQGRQEDGAVLAVALAESDRLRRELPELPGAGRSEIVDVADLPGDPFPDQPRSAIEAAGAPVDREVQGFDDPVDLLMIAGSDPLAQIRDDRDGEVPKHEPRFDEAGVLLQDTGPVPLVGHDIRLSIKKKGAPRGAPSALR